MAPTARSRSRTTSRATRSAKIFSQVGKKTDLFARFTTVAGERGAADAERDIRGFAVKFYTEEGNWDLVGNNTPVFFLRDPLKFPDLNHAVKRDPRTNLRSAKNNWDFWTSLPEALHQVTIVMSDRGIPATYRHMHGFGSHTFSFINAKNERYWVRVPLQVASRASRTSPMQEAEALIGRDRESHQRDLLRGASRAATSRSGRCKIQVDARGATPAKSPYQPLRSDQGLAAQGLPADRCRRDGAQPQPGELLRRGRASCVHSGQRRARASASHPTRCCRARLFSYGDAQRYRLGVNHHLIPVNAPRCPVHSYHRDGAMRVDGNHGGTLELRNPTTEEWAGAADVPRAAAQLVEAPRRTGTIARTATISRSLARCSD